MPSCQGSRQVSDATLRELLYGKGAHVDVLACVEDLTAVLVGTQITGYPHTIWQIVGHMNYWMDNELNRIEGHPKPYPEHAIESWPASTGPASQEEWQGAVEDFRRLLGQLAALSDAGPEMLNREVRGTHPVHDARTVTVHTILWQMVAHNSYHAGQIALLRRSLGAGPLRNGSDTW